MTTRRQFLGSAAALSLAGRAGFAAPAKMFVSLNGSLTGGKVQWPEFVRLAAKVGYGGVDVNLGAAMKDGLEATRALLAETKMQPAYANLPVTFTRDDETFRKGMAGLEQAAKFLAGMGCRKMVTVLPPASETPKEEYRNIIKARLSEAGKVLAGSDVRLGLEFLGPRHFRNGRQEFIWRMPETLAFAKELGPNMGILLDVWHWHLAGATADDIVAAGNSRIVTVHLSDCKDIPADEVRDNQRLLPGQGVIDYKSFFGALKKIGYTGAVSPEPLGAIPKEASAEEGARMGLESTLAVMHKAGVA
jgi:sugar phosphate isomerase/epimerase